MEPGPDPLPLRGEDVLAHGRFLRTLARALVGDPTRAEDLVQDTWLAALEHPPGQARAPRAWLAQILRRRAIRSGLREAERGAREGTAHDPDPATASPDAVAAQIEVSRRVFEGLERLREPYRHTLFLRYYRGLTPLVIARDSGLPVKTVKTRLARGLELLREDLDRTHGGRREVWVTLLLPLSPPWPGVRALPRALPWTSLAIPGVVLVLASAVAVGLGRALVGGATRTPASVHASPVGSSEARRLRVEGEPDGTRRPVSTVAVAPSTAAKAELLRLRGRVLDPSGTALDGVEVRAEWLGDGRAASLARGACAEATVEASTRSGADGAFVLALERGGLLCLVLEADGRAPLGRRLYAVLGQDLDLGPLVLERGVTLAGSVVDDAGAPLEGVRLQTVREDDGLGIGGREGGPGGGVRSDAHGHFEITRQASGPWRLEASADGFVTAWTEGFTAAPGARVEGLRLELAPGWEVTGRVLGIPDGSASRAYVLVVDPEGSSRSQAHERGSRRVALDPQGGFRIDGLRAEATLQLASVLDLGRGSPVLGPLQSARAGDRGLKLLLPAQDDPRRGLEPPEAYGDGVVVVRVLRSDGEPEAGAVVARRDGVRGMRDARMCVTDAMGVARFEGLAPGAHAFAVLPAFLGPAGVEPSAWTAIQSGALPETLVLRAPEVATLRGRVRSGDVPLAGARVLLRRLVDGEREEERARPWDEAIVLRTHCAAAGGFVLEGLPLGRWLLELRHPSRVVPERRELHVPAGGVDVDLDLGQARLAGRVLDPDGAPLADARVRARRSEGPADDPADDARGAEVRTDASGAFELVGLEPGRELGLEVARTGCATAFVRSLPDRFLELVLEPEVGLTLGLGGEVPPRVRLQAIGPRGERHTFALMGRGTHALHGLAAGPWRLELALPRSRARRDAPVLSVREVVLTAGTSSTLRWDLP